MLLRNISIVLLSVVCLTSGCGGDNTAKFTAEELAEIPLVQKTNLPAPSGGLVLAVSDDFITAEEIVTVTVPSLEELACKSNFEQFKNQTTAIVRKLVEQKITDILLYNEAKKEIRKHSSNIDELLEKMAEVEVKKFIARFDGDYAEAEAELQKAGMDLADFREHQKKLILTQSYLAEQFGETGPVTHSELLDYYNEIKKNYFTRQGYIRFRLIDIQPERMTEENANQTEAADNKTRPGKLAAQIMEKIRAGEDFGRLAGKYSHGHRAAMGGLWGRVRPGSLAEPYDILEEAVSSLQPGQTAGPIETEKHIFIIKLEEKQADGFEPFEKVQQQVEKKLILKRRGETVEKLVAKLIRKASAGDIEAFVDFCVAETYRISNIE